MTDVVIVGAARTPIGAFNGALSSLPAHLLGKTAITAALSRAKVAPGEVDEVVLGQILTAGAGQNPGRQAAIAAGIPVEKTAYVLNQLCGSGLRAVALGYQAIRNGDNAIVVAGGQESMSQAPHCGHLRNGIKMGNAELVDTMIKDGLWDAFNGYHMGNTAENVAQKWQITRAQQDEFAAGSQQKAEAAQKAGRFKDEIVPVTVTSRKGDVIVDSDEFPRHGTTSEQLAKLRPSFLREGGTVTAGNASQLSDGASATLLMSAARAVQLGVEPLGIYRGTAVAGCGPEEMGIGPVFAVPKLLRRHGLKLDDVDIIELNEAFASQLLYCQRRLEIPDEKLNPLGGSISIGHPYGMTGSRMTGQLLRELRRQKKRLGLVTMCIGGGMGMAGLFEAC